MCWKEEGSIHYYNTIITPSTMATEEHRARLPQLSLTFDDSARPGPLIPWKVFFLPLWAPLTGTGDTVQYQRYCSVLGGIGCASWRRAQPQIFETGASSTGPARIPTLPCPPKSRCSRPSSKLRSRCWRAKPVGSRQPPRSDAQRLHRHARWIMQLLLHFS